MKNQFTVDRTISEEVINHYGRLVEHAVCIEELTELIQVITDKIRRNHAEPCDHMVEEIADVLIVITNLMQMYCITDSMVQKMIDSKQQRQVDRMKRGE